MIPNPTPEQLRIAELEAELARVRRQLADRKLVDQAKGLLMDHHGWTEAVAYRFLQKRAMDLRRPLGEVARLVLEGGIDPRGSPANHVVSQRTRR